MVLRRKKTERSQSLIKLTLLCAGVLSHAQARADVWIVGGGSRLANSQVQIESNVLSLQSYFSTHANAQKLHTFFSDGDHPAPDISYRSIAQVGGEWSILQHIFDYEQQTPMLHRNHQVPDVSSSTKKSALVPELTKGLLKLEEKDEALFIFNGHGSKSRDIRDNAMMLWDSTSFSVRELDEILNLLPENLPVRMIFTQCFSGAFANLIYRESNLRKGMSSYTRCGFFAESPYHEAEGCSASLKVDEYRDYTRYLFSALKGQTLDGENVLKDIDRDNDQQVSLREAHLYTLGNAYNSDLPRSTSEVFLEHWQPWYTKWHSNTDLPDNEYGQLARDLQKRLALESMDAVFADREKVTEERILNREQLADATLTRDELAETIKQNVLERWPVLAKPYSPAYLTLMQDSLADISGFIQSSGQYAELLKAQNDLIDLEREGLRLERHQTQLDKLVRLRKLARTLANFDLLANKVRRQEYQRLLDCEEAIIK